MAAVEWTGLDSTSKAEQVAGELRDRIEAGDLRPGDALSEKEITAGLGISRNTLREAFRLLVHERLLEHKLNHGFIVRRVGLDDLRDLYRVRRLIECAAVRELTEIPPDASKRLHAAVHEAEQARDEHRWADVGTANLKFHQGIVGLLGSPHLDELMRRVSAELRLVWDVITDAEDRFKRYVPLNREIFELLCAGDFAGAEKKLDVYLAAAEDQFVTGFTARAENG